MKLLVAEEGSELALSLWQAADVIVASRLAYPEVRAALAAAFRARRMGLNDLQRAETLWDGCWAATRIVELTDKVSRHAGLLAGEHSLRGADAVHLASAVAVQSDDLVFVAWDGRLRDGAERVGFALAPA